MVRSGVLCLCVLLFVLFVVCLCVCFVGGLAGVGGFVCLFCVVCGLSVCVCVLCECLFVFFMLSLGGLLSVCSSVR